MKVTLERLPESRVQLDIEVDNDRLERSLDAAYKRLAARSRIPGFRPGKAPRHIVERMVGRDGLIREALDRLVPDAYNEAIEAEDVEAIAQPELEILEMEPVRFKATVPVRPTVDIDGYRGIRVERDPVKVTDEMVAEQLLLLRRRHATQVPVERPVQWDDVLIADVNGLVEDDPFIQDADAEFALREGQVLLVPGLAEAFIGMSKGEEKQVDIDIPDDFRVERLQGKTASFTLTLKEVKEEQLPEEDDEFANTVNPDEFPTLDALKARIRTDLESALTEEVEAKLRSDAVTKLVEIATIDHPRVLVEREIDGMVSEAAGNDRQAYAAYLQRVGRSEQEFREQFREDAERRLRRSLALGELADKENVEISAEEIDAELDRMCAPLGEEAARFKQMLATPDRIESIGRELLTRKTLDRLAGIAIGQATATTEPAASDTESPAPEAEAAPATETPAEAEEETA